MDRCVKLSRLDDAIIHDDIHSTTKSIHFQSDHNLRDQATWVRHQHNDSLDKDFELANKRAQLDSKLKKTFESIFEKYGKDFDGIGDEIDIATGEIVVNNGHVLFMHDEKDAGERNLQNDKQLVVDNLSNDLINNFDKCSVFETEATKEKCDDEKFKDIDETINSIDDQEEDDLILRGFFRANRYLQMKPKEEIDQNCAILYNSPHNCVSSCTLAGGISLDSRPDLAEKPYKNKFERLPVNETQIEKAWRVPDLPISQQSDGIESAWRVPCISTDLLESCKAEVTFPHIFEDRQFSPPQKVKSLWAPAKLSVARIPDRLDKSINRGEKPEERVHESNKNRQPQINKVDWRTHYNARKNTYQALNSVEKRLLLDWVAKGRQEGLAEQRIFKEFRAKYPHRTLKAWKCCFQEIDPHLINESVENKKEATSQRFCNAHVSKEPKESKIKPIIEVHPHQDEKNQEVSKSQKCHELSQSLVSPIDRLNTPDCLDHNLQPSNLKQGSSNPKSDILPNKHVSPKFQSPDLMKFEKQKANVIETEGSLIELHTEADSESWEQEKLGQLIPLPKNTSCSTKPQLTPKKLFENSLQAAKSVGENCIEVSHAVNHLNQSDCHSPKDCNNLAVLREAHTCEGSCLDDIIPSQTSQITAKEETERLLTEKHLSIQASLTTHHLLQENFNEIDKTEAQKIPKRNSSKNFDMSQSNCKTYSLSECQEVAIHQSETQSNIKFGIKSEIRQSSARPCAQYADSTREEPRSSFNNASKTNKALVPPLGIEEIDELSLGQKEILLISSEPRPSFTADCQRILGKEDPLQSPALKLTVRRRKKRKLSTKGDEIDELGIEHERSHFDLQAPSLALTWPDISVPRTKINELENKEKILQNIPSSIRKRRLNEGHPPKVREVPVSCSHIDKLHPSGAESPLLNITVGQKKIKSDSNQNNSQLAQELSILPQNKSENVDMQELKHALNPPGFKRLDNHGKSDFKCGKLFCFQCH
ncbi:Bgt-1422 [Blumeria graminis f. sp. tritici]|uniref:Bgt-1422 n=2 Tax=Blumeria graminis f. sp. tritici TaxID=62690 RepID=A0A061HD11_BLUGR|nr:hypothetical protein BGT96224_1422 [Blumeria graminis f. sp. tritici 96224]VCU40237.1 Bgt-1422 [Blumeria graminis f. sp. tritici]